MQNTGSILPLSTATTKSIAVIGPDGTTSPQTAGGGSSHVTASSVISPLAVSPAAPALRRRSHRIPAPTRPRPPPLPSKPRSRSCSRATTESEGSDLTNISLPNGQDAMIEAVAAANPNTIVVLNTGGPVLMPWLSSVKGVLEAWYPGQDDGSAIASVLFGDIDPSGHLPQTFPTSLSEIPTAVADSVSRGQRPGRLFRGARRRLPLVRRQARHAAVPVRLRPVVYELPFQPSDGYARIGRQQCVRAGCPGGQNARLARVTATVTNTGQVRGSDVAQLYIGDPTSAGEPPRQLEGFHRVTLLPGQSRTVSFTITGHELSYFNPRANGWTLPNGRFSLYVGDSSALTSLPLRGKLNVARTIGSRYARLTAPATVNPGATFIAKATFVNHGNMPITNGIVRSGSRPGGRSYASRVPERCRWRPGRARHATSV